MSGIKLAVGGGMVLGSLLGSKSQGKSTEKAASIQSDAAREANALQKYMYETNRADMQPFRDIELRGANVGIQNLDRMNALMSPGFKESEGYKFNLGQGVNALDRSAIPMGRSRNADIMRFSQGLASKEYNTYLDRVQGLAGTSTGYANAMSGAGQGYANAFGRNVRYGGDAAAQSALAGGRAQAQMWNTIGNAPANAFALYNMYQQPTAQPA